MARTSATRRTRREGSPLRFVFWTFVLSRAFFLGVGALAHFLLPQALPGGIPGPRGVLGYWANWDGAWYSGIATSGYGLHAPESTAFFPLYPLLVHLGVRLGGGVAPWGVAVSLAALPFAFYFVYETAARLHGDRAARASVLTLAFFPTAFFLNAVYTESLFLALSAGCLWAALVRRDLLLAGFLGALAAATRNLGVLLLLPLFLEWVRNRREFGRRGLAEIAVVPAGLCAYALYLAGRFGDPLVFARQQRAYWGRTLTDPLATARMAWRSAREGARYLVEPHALFVSTLPEPSLAASNTLNLAFFALFTAVMAFGVFVLPPGLSLYALALVLVPLLTPSPLFPLMSLPRFLLDAFPFFIALGVALSRSRNALFLWLILSAFVGATLTALFVTWRWVA
ncbi:MAG: glycosyltransferase family 39 protein [Rubrobacteraceae bacterium]|nr:glycosyltransferase family 39 protein [Rubrobacteraceae bacterium]